MSSNIKSLLVGFSLISVISGCGKDNSLLHCEPKTKSVGMWFSAWYKGDGTWFKSHTPALGHYDSGNSNVIDAQVSALSTAKVDFIILDNTNNLYVDGGYILRNSQAICTRLGNLKFAIAIGGIQFNNKISTLDFEINEVNRLFVNGPCANNYLRDNGKPVIYSYMPETIPNSDLDALKAQYSAYSMEWVHGYAHEGEAGWATPEALPSCGTMSLMPGWRNAQGAGVDRASGTFYDHSINTTLSVNPSRVVIASYNDYAEDTFVEPTQEYGSTYWTQTVNFIKAYKQ